MVGIVECDLFEAYCRAVRNALPYIVSVPITNVNHHNPFQPGPCQYVQNKNVLDAWLGTYAHGQNQLACSQEYRHSTSLKLLASSTQHFEQSCGDARACRHTTEVKTPDVSAVTGGEPCCASPASTRLDLQSCTAKTFQSPIKSHLAPQSRRFKRLLQGTRCWQAGLARDLRRTCVDACPARPRTWTTSTFLLVGAICCQVHFSRLRWNLP